MPQDNRPKPGDAAASDAVGSPSDGKLASTDDHTRVPLLHARSRLRQGGVCSRYGLR
jgi:hypothetical protein